MNKIDLLTRIELIINAIKSFKGEGQTASNKLYIYNAFNRAQQLIFDLEDKFNEVHPYYNQFNDLSSVDIYSILD